MSDAGSHATFRTVLGRVLAPILGIAAVLASAPLAPGGAAWWIAIAGLVMVAVEASGAWPAGAAGAVLVIVVGGAFLAAVGDQLSIPSAAVVGVLLLCYVLAIDLAGTARDARLGPGRLSGWLRGAAALLGAGVAAGVAVALLMLVRGGPWLALLGPYALLVGVLTAVGNLRRGRASRPDHDHDPGAVPPLSR